MDLKKENLKDFILTLNQKDINNITEEELVQMATFATNYASLTTIKTGAISSYLTEEEYNSLI